MAGKERKRETNKLVGAPPKQKLVNPTSGVTGVFFKPRLELDRAAEQERGAEQNSLQVPGCSTMDNAEVKAPPAIQPEATKAGPGRPALSKPQSPEEAAAPAINFEDEGASAAGTVSIG